MTKSRRPTHPSAVLREGVIPALSTTVAGLANMLGVPYYDLAEVLAERTPITAYLALRLGRVLGNGPSLWIQMQVACDLWDAEQDMQDVLERLTPAPTLIVVEA